MRYIAGLFISVPLLFFKLSAAQEPSAPPALPVQLSRELVALRDAALEDNYAYQQVAHLTENIGPRPDGSPQAQAAAQYVAQELRRLGLDVRLEEVMVPQWIRGPERAELVEYPGQAPGTTQKIVVTALGGNTPTPPDGVTAEVAVVRDYAELDALGREKIAGKVVLFNVIFDESKAAAGHAFDAYQEAVGYRARGAKAAAKLGAVASLVRSVGAAGFRLAHTGWSEAAGIPAGAVTSEDAALIADLAAQGTVRLRLVLAAQNGPDVSSHNVVADLKGAEHPEQIVMVSGHVDSWDLGTGAIDDAAGVAVAMEAAEVVQRLHLRPKRTLRVVAWMDEENGGRGHDAYAKDHAAELSNHVGAIESDSGADHPLGYWARVNPAALLVLQPVQEILRTFGASLMQTIREGPGADIAPLAKAGVPAFGLMQDGRTYFIYHHTAADTLDKINPRELRENGAAMAVLGYALACLPQALPRGGW
jgi:carboxypeptidase Q